MKFNAGDKVKVIDPSCPLVNRTGTVTGITSSFSAICKPFYVVDLNGYTFWAREHEIELIGASMKFKIGDQVEVIDPGSWAFGLLGEILSIHTSGGQTRYMVKPYATGNLTGNLTGMYATGHFDESALAYPIQLSPGQDQTAFDIVIVQQEPKIATKECDCGAFKTYNSMSPEVHSGWCSSVRG